MKGSESWYWSGEVHLWHCFRHHRQSGLYASSLYSISQSPGSEGMEEEEKIVARLNW